MFDFCPKPMKTNVDFIAFTVAKMEHEQRGLCVHAVSGNMPLEMSELFHQRLRFYREKIKYLASRRSPFHSCEKNDVLDYS